MSIAILTDSTCDLPQEIVDALGIWVVPMLVHFGDESYLDGVTISREEFYRKLVTSDVMPKTAAPGINTFLDAYRSLADAGASHIISLHISSTLSAVMNIAQKAAESSPVPVTVVDSGSLTLGTGFLAQTAAEAVRDGKSLPEILAILQSQRSRTHVFAALETLEYLRRGGRMNALLATFGTWLKIKPLMKMHNGVAQAEKIRTSKAATLRLIDLLMEKVPVERAAMVHTNSEEKATALKEQVISMLPPEPVFSVDITPVFGVHLGPGAVGFTVITTD